MIPAALRPRARIDNPPTLTPAAWAVLGYVAGIVAIAAWWLA
jgi:hypothetical protein